MLVPRKVWGCRGFRVLGFRTHRGTKVSFHVRDDCQWLQFLGSSLRVPDEDLSFGDAFLSETETLVMPAMRLVFGFGEGPDARQERQAVRTAFYAMQPLQATAGLGFRV